MKQKQLYLVMALLLFLAVPYSFAQEQAAAQPGSAENPMTNMGYPTPMNAEMRMDAPVTTVTNTQPALNKEDVAVVTAQAHATIKGTTEGSPIKGEISFNETKDGVIIDAEVFDVPNPGLHGFHVHEKGSCDEEGKAAGGHYNPDNVEHGDMVHNGHMNAHAGDMGNITIDDKGHGTYTALLPGLTLTGEKYNISGLAVILHEKADDFGQPTGNAGGRIGCGVITQK